MYEYPLAVLFHIFPLFPPFKHYQRLVSYTVHWVPLTTSSVTTSTQLLRADNFLSSLDPIIDYNVKKFSYNEHPVTTSTYLCIKMLVVSGTQCKSTPSEIELLICSSPTRVNASV